MPHAYTEDQLVEQPAIGLFAELGWQTASALEETFGATGTLLRETKGEVVLVSRLRAALERLNPTLPPEAITAAVDELTRDRSAMSLEAANREVYLLLKEGIKVSVPESDSTPHPNPLPVRGGEGGAVLVQRAAHRLERHGQSGRLAHGGLGAALRGPSRTGAKRIKREDEPRRVSLEVMLRGTCAIAHPEGSRLLSG